jgi:hypothetical protein
MEATTTQSPTLPQMVHRASRYAAEVLDNVAAGTDPYALDYEPAQHPHVTELTEVVRKLAEWECLVLGVSTGAPLAPLARLRVYEITPRGRELLAALTPA